MISTEVTYASVALPDTTRRRVSTAGGASFDTSYLNVTDAACGGDRSGPHAATTRPKASYFISVTPPRTSTVRTGRPRKPSISTVVECPTALNVDTRVTGHPAAGVYTIDDPAFTPSGSRVVATTRP